MARLKDRIQNVLDEARMLVLGAQVLLGFQYRSFFEAGFQRLPRAGQYLALAALGCLLLALGLLMSPGTHHQLVEQGRDSERLHSFANLVLGVALLPIALALGINVFLMIHVTVGFAAAGIAGLAAALTALFFWYGLEFITLRNSRQRKAGDISDDQIQDSNLTDLIKQVLTEARVVIPGAQALVGFQLTIILMDGFNNLPSSSKYIHLGSLGCIALSIIFLMTPAAYHRIVERGHDSFEFHRFASKMLIAGMVPLPLGISGDLFVVARKVTNSELASIVAAVFALCLFYGFWFGLTLLRKAARRSPRRIEQQLSS